MDIWHPVDCWFGNMLKSMVSKVQEEWLEDENNIDLPSNSDQKLNAKQRRILITHWVGEAYNRSSGEQYAGSRLCCFEKTGWLITADCSEDGKRNPEGLHGYSIPPPLPINSTEEPIQCQPPVPRPAPDDSEQPEESLQSKTGLKRKESTKKVIGFSRTSKGWWTEHHAFYDKWHTGTITWFNSKLKEYRVLFEDQSEESISLNDINGVDMILLNNWRLFYHLSHTKRFSDFISSDNTTLWAHCTGCFWKTTYVLMRIRAKDT